VGRLDRYKDVIEYSYPGVDVMQYFLGRKGFLEWLKSLDEKELLEFAKQYVTWRDRRLRECVVLRFKKEQGGVGEEEYDYRVYVPRLRALRRDYYAWIKKVELPLGRYRLVTLTLGRWISIVEAWKNINKWTSKCLHRVRNRIRREFGVDVFYVWIIEAHKDGYPHVHLLFTVDRFVEGLTFEVFLEMLVRYWVDDQGRALCLRNGIDVKYIGTNVQEVKNYILKYLVKDHSKIWGFEVIGGLVRVRLCTLLAWVFRVRFIGFSQKIKRAVSAVSDKKPCVFLGRTSVYRLWRFVCPEERFDRFLDVLLCRGYCKIDKEKIPYLLGLYEAEGLSFN
jgi:hypothetical protein